MCSFDTLNELVVASGFGYRLGLMKDERGVKNEFSLEIFYRKGKNAQ